MAAGDFFGAVNVHGNTFTGGFRAQEVREPGQHWLILDGVAPEIATIAIEGTTKGSTGPKGEIAYILAVEQVERSPKPVEPNTES